MEASDARRLLEFALARDAAYLLAHDDEPLAPDARARFEAALARRAQGEPVPYVTGRAGFYGRTFVVTPAVLVPRPETEHLVALALERLRARAVPAPRICDVGTGSGILAVTLACELCAADVVALDASRAALVVAAENARSHGAGARIRFARSDLFAALAPDERFDCIVANLPYVATGELAQRADPTAFEPRIALDGGEDGLEIYERFLCDAPLRLARGGALLMEAGPANAARLASFARAAFGNGAEIDVERDYARLERVVSVRL